jgi:hypothetical protein
VHGARHRTAQNEAVNPRDRERPQGEIRASAEAHRGRADRGDRADSFGQVEHQPGGEQGPVGMADHVGRVDPERIETPCEHPHVPAAKVGPVVGGALRFAVAGHIQDNRPHGRHLRDQRRPMRRAEGDPVHQQRRLTRANLQSAKRAWWLLEHKLSRPRVETVFREGRGLCRVKPSLRAPDLSVPCAAPAAYLPCTC